MRFENFLASDGQSNCWNRYPSDQQPNDPRKEGFNHPMHRCGNGRQRVSCSFGNGTDDVTDKMHIIRLEAMDNNAAPNPDHGRSANSSEKRQESRHAENKCTSRFAAHDTGN